MYIMCTYWWMCPWLCPPVFWLQSHTAGRQCRLLHSLLCDQKGGQWIPDNEYQAIMPSAADFIPIRWSFIFSNTGSISSRVKLLEPTRPFSIPNKPPPFLELKTKEKKCTNYSLDNIKNVIPDTLKLIFHTLACLFLWWPLPHPLPPSPLHHWTRIPQTASLPSWRLAAFPEKQTRN